MMQPTATSKVTTEHLSRNAYLYVRQSTLRQVVENTESTKRQYGLHAPDCLRVMSSGITRVEAHAQIDGRSGRIQSRSYRPAMTPFPPCVNTSPNPFACGSTTQA